LKEISLHILDIAENSVNAGASEITIEVIENIKNDTLLINITDNGKGMSEETVAVISDPFVTTRTTRRVGLGIPFFKAAAEACDGSLSIKSELGKGTSVSIEFNHSHIDRMPMGDIEDTLTNLFIGYPNVDWLFKYNANGDSFLINGKEIKEILDDVPLSDPSVINFIRNQINDGIGKIRITE
jgi:anti-sigma regulatory factor (Ser/Thr protein kinase)